MIDGIAHLLGRGPGRLARLLCGSSHLSSCQGARPGPAGLPRPSHHQPIHLRAGTTISQLDAGLPLVFPLPLETAGLVRRRSPTCA